MNILATDVHYDEASGTARAAGVLFHAWGDAAPSATFTSDIAAVRGYVSGLFFQRELPCLQRLIDEHQLAPDVIVIDGYVHLNAQSRAGLGVHLYEALGRMCPVVGVAKTSFNGVDASWGLKRGGSARPLYVTAIGMSVAQAQAHVAAMHGQHRIPTLLTAVDHACRGWA